MPRFLLILAAVIIVQGVFVSRLDKAHYVSPEITSLSDTQGQALEAYREAVGLLTTLATLTLGAFGALFFGERKTALGSTASGTLIAIPILVGVSLYCGYLAHSRVAWMLSNSFFDLSIPQIVWIGRVQLWSLLVGVSLLSAALLSMLKRGNR
jgi:hypothetical protein